MVAASAFRPFSKGKFVAGLPQPHGHGDVEGNDAARGHEFDRLGGRPDVRYPICSYGADQQHDDGPRAFSPCSFPRHFAGMDAHVVALASNHRMGSRRFPAICSTPYLLVMKTVKNKGMQFQGELHDIYLINFSVEAREVADRIPEPIRPRLQQGRVLISMVDVNLRNMRAKSAWLPFTFNYQHIGFRVLVNDADWNTEHQDKGVYFLDSFTDRPYLIWAGNLLANFRLQQAKFTNYPAGLRLDCGDHFLEYDLCGPNLTPSANILELQTKIGAIDRSWAMEGNALHKTQIVREKWPLQPMNVNRFATNFFESARLEGAFRVTESIHYEWLPAETVQILRPSTPILQPALSYV